MKLKIKEFVRLARRKGFRSGYGLWLRIGGGQRAYSSVKNGCGVTYEMVQSLYNRYGEEETVKVVDFTEEGLNGFKAKYIQIGNRLY